MTRQERAKDARLRRKYGLTLKQFDRMMYLQKGKCAICYRPFLPDGKTRRPHVDHDHKTKRVRGLLCMTCNRYKVAKNDGLSAQQVAGYLMSNFDGRTL